MAGISTCKEANSFLLEYFPQFNRKFGGEPNETFSTFVLVPSSCDLDRLLSAELTRMAFLAGTKVTLLLSEKYGLCALINGAFYSIRCMDDLPHAHKKPFGLEKFPESFWNYFMSIS